MKINKYIQKVYIYPPQDEWIGDSSNSKGPGNFGLWRWCTDTQVGHVHILIYQRHLFFVIIKENKHLTIK